MSDSKTYKGILWASYQRFGTMIISFVGNLVLARLLTPKDFGVIGMLLFFITVTTVFVDSGFGSALIQKKDADERDYSTIFIVNMAISILLYIVLFELSPYIADFYNVAEVELLLKVEGLILIGNALGVVQNAILRKNMNFKKLANANVFGNLFGTLVSILAAFLGFGVWSLVIRVLLGSYLTSIFLWVLAKWRPLLIFDIKRLKSLFNFGGYMLLSTVLSTASANLQTLIIGKFYHPRVVGLYTQAQSLETMVADSLQKVVGQVLYPDYSSSKNDDEIILKLNKSFNIVSYFSIWILVLMILVADNLIVCLYSNIWVEAIPYFKIMCIGGIFYSIQDVNFYVVAAKGKSKLLANINMVKVPIFLTIFVLCAIYINMIAFLWMKVISTAITYFINAVFACKLLKINIKTQLGLLFKNLIYAFACAGIVYIVFRIISIDNIWLDLIFQIVMYIVITLCIGLLFKIYPLRYVLFKLKIDSLIKNK